MRLVLAAMVVAVAAAPARAEFQAAPLAVHVRLDGTTAAVRVRYAIDADLGLEPDSDALAIPTRGIVTGAVVTVDGSVHRLTLDASEQVAATFTAIGDAPGGPDRAWAVDISAELGLPSYVQVQIAAPHPARLLIDLEISAPTCFWRDVRYTLVPTPWLPKVDATLLPPNQELVATACPNPDSDSMTWIAFPSRDLATRPFGDQRIGTIGSRLALDTAHVARVELDLAREISHVPPDLYTAIVIDGSRSVGAGQRTDQQAIVEAYLRAAPNSHVQLVAYDRNARALLPAWTIASTAAARVTSELATLTARNGSNLDRGLAEAARWLAKVSGTRRIVVFSDELVAASLAARSTESLEALLPAGTLVHVVAITGEGNGTLDRDDGALFASLARATEGMAVQGSLDGDGHVDATKLVRPIALEHIAVQSPGWEATTTPLNDACPFDSHGDVAEGSSCSWWGIGDAVAGPIRIEGLVWGRRFVRVVRPDPSRSRVLARILSAIGGLPEELSHQIDRAALAVNATWSLFGSWAGNDGYADLAHGGGGWGTGGCACGDRGGFGSSGYGWSPAIPNDPGLKEQLARGIDRCAAGAAHFDIQLELTLDEIVEVGVTMRDGSPGLRSCIEEAVWDTNVTLPGAATHSTATIAFGD